MSNKRAFTRYFEAFKAWDEVSNSQIDLLLSGKYEGYEENKPIAKRLKKAVLSAAEEYLEAK